MPVESNKTEDSAPEVVVTRANGRVERLDRNPNDTLIGLMVIIAAVYLVLKLIKKFFW